MAGSLQLAGGPPQKQPRYVPLYTSRFWSGLVTNRSPLRSSGSAYEERYLGTRSDSLIDGGNCEITPRLTLARRPGNPTYNSNSFSGVTSFYSFREFTSTSEQIRVMVDDSVGLYDGTGNSKILVFTKSSGAGQSFMQSVGNTLFFANGIDQKKWVESLYTRTNGTGGLPNIGNSVTLNSVTTPFLSTYLVDSAGNLEQLLATQLTTITNVDYTGATNTLTLTVGSTAGMVAGDLQICWGLGTATWLNGITLTVLTASGVTVTANLQNENHADYTSAPDTGSLAAAIGGLPVTGGSVPTWSATTPASGNNYQGGITVDGTALWLNKGDAVENWGIAITTPAPSVSVGTSGSAWKADTFYSLAGVVIDSNGNLQQVTTAGKSGASAPTWAILVGNTTNDGTAVWTMIQTAASLTWAAHTAYTAGSFLVASASGTNCLFQLASPIITPYINGAISANGWNSTSNGGFNKSYPAPAADFTLVPPSLSWHGNTGQNTQMDQLNGAGEVIGATDTGHYESWEAAIWGILHIPVAGSYSFNLSHNDGAMIGFGGTAQKISGTVINDVFGTQTVVNGYPYMAGNNNSGDYPSDPLVVNFPTAGDYGFEINWTNWEHASRMVLTCNGFTIVPTGTPISMATQPIWPAWTTSYAPGYPNVSESSGQFKWNNLGPAVDYAWSANITFTLPNTTITDPANNTEAPYRTGVSGTAIPIFATGINQLTLDNPNLIWINEGPASAPAPGTISAFNGGYQYVVALVNSATDTVSNATQLSIATGNFIGAAGITISGGLPALANIDPQSDYVAIFRTTDGFTTPFLIPGTGNSIYTIPLSTYFQNGYTDTTLDTGLNNLISAPIVGENTPPANGAKNLTYHLSRIWFSIGNTVYWTSGPAAPVGNGVEGVLPSNNQVFPSLVTRIVPTTLGAFVYTVSDIYVIVGQSTDSSPIQPAYPYLQGIGLLNYNALDVNGALMGFYTSDKTFVLLDPSAGAVNEVGFNIGNKLGGSPWNSSNVYVTWHSYGEDKAWFVADGSTGWYRVSPTPSPEQGITWSPFATIVGGAKAVKSIETAPGVRNLLLGPTGTGSILNRSITTWTDGSSTYTWFAIVGSHVLANPGQLAEVAFIATDCVATGSRPSISVILDEAVPYFTGSFEPIAHWTTDPPNVSESGSKSLYSQRFYFSDTEQPAVCRSLQYRVDFPAESALNEILSCTIYGAMLVEN